MWIAVLALLCATAPVLTLEITKNTYMVFDGDEGTPNLSSEKLLISPGTFLSVFQKGSLEMLSIEVGEEAQWYVSPYPEDTTTPGSVINLGNLTNNGIISIQNTFLSWNLDMFENYGTFQYVTPNEVSQDSPILQTLGGRWLNRGNVLIQGHKKPGEMFVFWAGDSFPVLDLLEPCINEGSMYFSDLKIRGSCLSGDGCVQLDGSASLNRQIISKAVGGVQVIQFLPGSKANLHTYKNETVRGFGEGMSITGANKIWLATYEGGILSIQYAKSTLYVDLGYGYDLNLFKISSRDTWGTYSRNNAIIYNGPPPKESAWHPRCDIVPKPKQIKPKYTAKSTSKKTTTSSTSAFTTSTSTSSSTSASVSTLSTGLSLAFSSQFLNTSNVAPVVSFSTATSSLTELKYITTTGDGGREPVINKATQAGSPDDDIFVFEGVEDSFTRVIEVIRSYSNETQTVRETIVVDEFHGFDLDTPLDENYVNGSSVPSLESQLIELPTTVVEMDRNDTWGAANAVYEQYNKDEINSLLSMTTLVLGSEPGSLVTLKATARFGNATTILGLAASGALTTNSTNALLSTVDPQELGILDESFSSLVQRDNVTAESYSPVINVEISKSLTSTSNNASSTTIHSGVLTPSDSIMEVVDTTRLRNSSDSESTFSLASSTGFSGLVAAEEDSLTSWAIETTAGNGTDDMMGVPAGDYGEGPIGDLDEAEMENSEDRDGNDFDNEAAGDGEAADGEMADGEMADGEATIDEEATMDVEAMLDAEVSGELDSVPLVTELMFSTYGNDSTPITTLSLNTVLNALLGRRGSLSIRASRSSSLAYRATGSVKSFSRVSSTRTLWSSREIPRSSRDTPSGWRPLGSGVRLGPLATRVGVRLLATRVSYPGSLTSQRVLLNEVETPALSNERASISPLTTSPPNGTVSGFLDSVLTNSQEDTTSRLNTAMSEVTSSFVSVAESVASEGQHTLLSLVYPLTSPPSLTNLLSLHPGILFEAISNSSRVMLGPSRASPTRTTVPEVQSGEEATSATNQLAGASVTLGPSPNTLGALKTGLGTSNPDDGYSENNENLDFMPLYFAEVVTDFETISACTKCHHPNSGGIKPDAEVTKFGQPAMSTSSVEPTDAESTLNASHHAQKYSTAEPVGQVGPVEVIEPGAQTSELSDLFPLWLASNGTCPTGSSMSLNCTCLPNQRQHAGLQTEVTIPTVVIDSGRTTSGLSSGSPFASDAPRSASETNGSANEGVARSGAALTHLGWSVASFGLVTFFFV